MKKSIVRVKDKFQVTLPARLRKRATIAVGDLLEVTIRDGVYLLRPQRVEARTEKKEKHDE